MRLEQERRERDTLRRQRMKEELQRIRKRASQLLVLDPRSADEIVGYNELGTFD